MPELSRNLCDENFRGCPQLIATAVLSGDPRSHETAFTPRSECGFEKDVPTQGKQTHSDSRLFRLVMTTELDRWRDIAPDNRALLRRICSPTSKCSAHYPR